MKGSKTGWRRARFLVWLPILIAMQVVAAGAGPRKTPTGFYYPTDAMPVGFRSYGYGDGEAGYYYGVQQPPTGQRWTGGWLDTTP